MVGKFVLLTLAFHRRLQIGKNGGEVILLEPLSDGFTDSSGFVIWLKEVGIWCMMRAPIVLPLCGALGKLFACLPNY